MKIFFVIFLPLFIILVFLQSSCSQSGCSQSYLELKELLDVNHSKYDVLVKNVNYIHNVINRDELDNNFNPCDCDAVNSNRMLIEMKQNQSINNIIENIENIHHCVFDRQNRILKGDIIDRGNFLDKYKKMSAFIKEMIIKMRVIKQHQLPLYVEYFQRLSKECRNVGETLESNLRQECKNNF
jgi:hypothetical protein